MMLRSRIALIILCCFFFVFQFFFLWFSNTDTMHPRSIDLNASLKEKRCAHQKVTFCLNRPRLVA